MILAQFAGLRSNQKYPVIPIEKDEEVFFLAVGKTMRIQAYANTQNLKVDRSLLEELNFDQCQLSFEKMSESQQALLQAEMYLRSKVRSVSGKEFDSLWSVVREKFSYERLF